MFRMTIKQNTGRRSSKREIKLSGYLKELENAKRKSNKVITKSHVGRI